MVVAALLTADQRLAFQIQTWMKDVADTIQLEVHSDVGLFTQKIETEIPSAGAPKQENAAETAVDIEDLGSGKSIKAGSTQFYRVLIVDVDLLLHSNQRPLTWATNMKELLQAKGRSDAAFPTRILFMSFEGGAIHPDGLRHEAVDDLVLKPLDRSLLLQKLELLVAEAPGVKPSFLFRQMTEMVIEAGKDVMIDEVSEFALAIRNPTPLADGVFAIIHSEIFGEGALGRIIARVYKSEKHPSIEGEYLVRLGYFGIKAAQMANVKKYQRAHQMPGRAKSNAKTVPVKIVDPPVPFNQIAIIDMDDLAVSEITSTIKDHYVGVAVTCFPSYSRFLVALNKLIPETAKPALSVVPAKDSSDVGVLPESQSEAPPEVASEHPAWSGAAPLVFALNGVTGELIRFISGGVSGEPVLGKTQEEWVTRPGDWLATMEKQDAKDFGQLLDYVRGGGQGRSYVRVKDDQQKTHYLEAKGSLEKSGEADGLLTIKIELHKMDEPTWTAAVAKLTADAEIKDPSAMRFDAIFVDGNLIRGEIPVWIDGLKELFAKANVLLPGDPFPKIVILANEKSPLKPEAYRFKSIGDFVYKPLDRNFMSHKAKTLVPELVPRGEPNFAPFVHCEVPAKLAKNVTMEEISEYGLTMSHPSAFRPNVYMRFFSELFGEKNEGVIGRCSHCTEKQGEGEGYSCHFTFFGTSNDILTRIRTWIREDYVHRKEAT